MSFDRALLSSIIDKIAMGPFGSNIKVECFVEKGVPVLNGSNISGTRLSEDSFRYVTREKADSLGKANAHRGDIVVTHRGTLGQIAYIPNNSRHARYVISQSQFLFRCAVNKALPEFVVYYFHTYEGQQQILSNKSQVGVPALARPTSTFQMLTIPLPPLPEQKAIADTLSCLDDKIELNNRMNRTLEEMAQAVFKSWFVDFEPFQDGEFVDSELGPIPKGWRVGTLGEIAEISTKSINPSKTPETLFEHYSIPAYDEANFPVFEKGNNIKSNKYLIPCDAWLISKLNPTTKRVWQPFMLSKNAICSTEFIVYSASKLRYRDFCFESTNSANFFDFLCSNTSGSTNSRQRAIPKETLKYQLVIPTENIVKGFSQLVDPIYARMKNNLVECRRLISLRDSLLPKLMSGEIRVPMEAK